MPDTKLKLFSYITWVNIQMSSLCNLWAASSRVELRTGCLINLNSQLC
jgi:hypothetical protein